MSPKTLEPLTLFFVMFLLSLGSVLAWTGSGISYAIGSAATTASLKTPFIMLHRHLFAWLHRGKTEWTEGTAPSSTCIPAAGVSVSIEGAREDAVAVVVRTQTEAVCIEITVTKPKEQG